MGVTKRRFVAKVVPVKGWRVWDTLRKRFWGNVYTVPPTQLLDELNDEKDGQRIAVFSTEIARRRRR